MTELYLWALARHPSEAELKVTLDFFRRNETLPVLGARTVGLAGSPAGRGPLLATNAAIELVVEASRGTIELPSVRPLEAISGYRAIFDLRPDDSLAPINLSLHLALDGVALSETWFYQYSPPPFAERQI